MRVGCGFDAHRLVPGRPLVLGGVRLDYPLGLDGHSDADVLAHALMDALLGAVGAGDIGLHFPDSDPHYKGISSLELLQRVREILAEQGYRVVNVDATVIAQAPRLAPHVAEMRRKLADALQVDAAQVGVKATTTEGMGFTGRGEGIAAQAVALVDSLSAAGYNGGKAQSGKSEDRVE